MKMKSRSLYPAEAPDATMFTARWGQCKDHLRRAVAIATFFGLVLSLLQLALPLFSMLIFDRVLPSGQLATLIVLAGIVIFLLIMSTFIDACRSQVLAKSSYVLSACVDKTITMRAVGGTSSSILLTDLDAVLNLLTSPTLISTLDAPWSILSLLVLTFVNFWLGVYTAASFFITLVVSTSATYSLREGKKEALMLNRDINSSMQTDTFSIQDLVAMGIMPGVIAKVTGLRAFKRNRSLRLAYNMAVFDASGRTVRALLQVGVMIVAATLAVAHKIDAGAIVASSMLFTRSIAPVERISNTLDTLRRARQAWRNIDTFVSRGGVTGGTISPLILGKLSLKDVFVTLPCRQESVLSGISLDLEPGHLYVIVGDEGSGKSTLAKLLCGGIIASRGIVHLDGMSLSNFDQCALASQVGYLPENYNGRRGTIRSLICREGEACDESVLDAARLAGLAGLIGSLASGYYTEVTPNTGLLSAGQLKRLAIARAVYRRPQVLVLDEPLTGLDTTGEDIVLNIVKEFKEKNKTVVVVAKSPRLLQMADTLLLLERGKLLLSVGERSLRGFVGPRGVVA